MSLKESMDRLTVAIQDRRQPERIGRRSEPVPLSTVAVEAMNAVPGLPQQFKRVVPEQHLTRVGDVFEIHCVCSEVITMEVGELVSGECGRFFIALRDSVRVANPPAP